VRWIAIGVGTVALVAVWFWWSAASDSSGCPVTLARAVPSTVDDASSLIAACSADDVRARLYGGPLLDLMSSRSPALPPAAWLAPDSPLHRHLTDLGFEYPDDMSFAVLSAAWHDARGLPFDPKSTADCLRAWNRKMRQWVDSVPPGSPVPPPEFGCASLEEIDEGRHLWPKE
jgi:hypothetical protein